MTRISDPKGLNSRRAHRLKRCLKKELKNRTELFRNVTVEGFDIQTHILNSPRTQPSVNGDPDYEVKNESTLKFIDGSFINIKNMYCSLSSVWGNILRYTRNGIPLIIKVEEETHLTTGSHASATIKYASIRGGERDDVRHGKRNRTDFQGGKTDDSIGTGHGKPNNAGIGGRGVDNIRHSKRNRK